MSLSWRYVDGALAGPSPIPPVPVLSIHGADLCACPHDSVAEVDQELRRVVLGSVLPLDPWSDACTAHAFSLGDWQGPGWYAVYVRRGRRFHLASVHVDRYVTV